MPLRLTSQMGTRAMSCRRKFKAIMFAANVILSSGGRCGWWQSWRLSSIWNKHHCHKDIDQSESLQLYLHLQAKTWHSSVSKWIIQTSSHLKNSNVMFPLEQVDSHRKFGKFSDETKKEKHLIIINHPRWCLTFFFNFFFIFNQIWMVISSE